MDITIYCPNCKKDLARDNFEQADEAREYVCDFCNSRFNLAMIDEGEQLVDRIHNGAEFDLRVGNNESYVWSEVDDNLDPVLACPLCAGEIVLNKLVSDGSRKCRKCGTLLNIFMA